LSPINVNEALASPHELVVGDIKGDDDAGDLRNYADRATVGIRVIGTFHVAG
jgi:hypothetical protein